MMKKREFRRLVGNAVVVHKEPWTWRAQMLGPGTVVEVFSPGSQFESPLKINGDIPVHWMDCVGRVYYGWLAGNTVFHTLPASSTLKHEPYDADEPVSALDILRERAANLKLTFTEWLRLHGTEKKNLQTGKTELYRPYLEAVVRELGGKHQPKDDITWLATRVGRRVLNNPEFSMAKNKAASAETAEETEAPVSTKKAKRAAQAVETETPRKTKRAAAESEGKGRTSQAQSCGEKLVPLLKKAKASEAQKLAQTLADGGTLKPKQYVALRDQVNAAASAAREADNGSLASELSACNRIVRRLARAAAAA